MGVDSVDRFTGVEIARHLEAVDVFGGARLDEDRLPDPARARIPAPLLADRLLPIFHGIFHAEDDGRGELPSGVASRASVMSNSNGRYPLSFLPRCWPLHQQSVKKSAAPTVEMTRFPRQASVCGTVTVRRYQPTS
jgi:hypothetical protein